LAYKNSGRLAEAEKAFLQALDIDDRHWHAAFNLAWLRLGRKDRAGAIEALRLARKRGVAAGDDTKVIDAALRELGAE